MSIQAKVNVKSARKYADNVFGAQVIVTDHEANKTFYAVRVKAVTRFDVEIELNNIYQFIDGSWSKTVVDDQLIASLLEAAMRRLVIDYSHLFVKDISKARDKSVFGMWGDTIVWLGSNKDSTGHTLKIGDKIFESKDVRQLVAEGARTIEYQIMGDDETHTLHLLKDLLIATRLLKQFDKAVEKYERARDSKPIGFRTWDDLRDSRKQAGIGWQTARQYHRGR